MSYLSEIKEDSLLILKPGPNDRSISTQHVLTLLAQHLPAPAKRSQQLNATYRNIVRRNMLHAFDHPVATSCDTFHEPGQTTTTSCKMHKCWVKNLTIFKFEPKTPNTSQHFATRHKREAKRVQYVAANSVVICCVDILRSFGRGFTVQLRLKRFTAGVLRYLVEYWTETSQCQNNPKQLHNRKGKCSGKPADIMGKKVDYPTWIWEKEKGKWKRRIYAKEPGTKAWKQEKEPCKWICWIQTKIKRLASQTLRQNVLFDSW